MLPFPSRLCETLWTLHRNRSVVKLCAREIAGGVLMCYSVNGSVVMTTTLPDGPAMVRKAAALRFGLEARGWSPDNRRVGVAPLVGFQN